MSDCSYCRKLAALDDVPADEIVAEFTHSIAFLGPWQCYQGHCIVVSRTHAVELSQLSPAERLGYFQEMCIVACAIELCFQPHKLNYELLGNQVPHLHWHLFPRYRHDPNLLQAVWVDLDRAERDAALKERLQKGPLERQAVASTLRRKVSELL